MIDPKETADEREPNTLNQPADDREPNTLDLVDRAPDDREPNTVREPNTRD